MRHVRFETRLGGSNVSATLLRFVRLVNGILLRDFHSRVRGLVISALGPNASGFPFKQRLHRRNRETRPRRRGRAYFFIRGERCCAAGVRWGGRRDRAFGLFS